MTCDKIYDNNDAHLILLILIRCYLDVQAKIRWHKSKSFVKCGHRFGHPLPPDTEGIGDDALRSMETEKHRLRRRLDEVDPQFYDDLRDDKAMLAGVSYMINCKSEYPDQAAVPTTRSAIQKEKKTDEAPRRLVR